MSLGGAHRQKQGILGGIRESSLRLGILRNSTGKCQLRTAAFSPLAFALSLSAAGRFIDNALTAT
jgi:hypothetical protein